MKAKIAFEILLLACVSISGRDSCPIDGYVTSAALKLNSLNNCIKSSESETPAEGNCFCNDFDFCVKENISENGFKELTSRNHSSQEQVGLLSTKLAEPLDFSKSESDISTCIIIEIQQAVYVNCPPPPLPEQSVTAFIRNGILRV